MEETGGARSATRAEALIRERGRAYCLARGQLMLEVSPNLPTTPNDASEEKAST